MRPSKLLLSAHTCVCAFHKCPSQVGHVMQRRSTGIGDSKKSNMSGATMEKQLEKQANYNTLQSNPHRTTSVRFSLKLQIFPIWGVHNKLRVKHPRLILRAWVLFQSPSDAFAIPLIKEQEQNGARWLGEGLTFLQSVPVWPSLSLVRVSSSASIPHSYPSCSRQWDLHWFLDSLFQQLSTARLHWKRCKM